MGNVFQKLFDKLFQNAEEKRILMLGLDSAGKTTALYQMKVGEAVNTIPTIGFNVEEVKYKNINFTVWDVGGQEKIRPLWGHYFRDVDCLIFMVDAHDTNRFKDAAKELHGILNDTEFPKNAGLIVFANKQDLPNAASANQITNEFYLHKIKNRQWFCQATQATTGDGFKQGFEWIAKCLENQSRVSKHQSKKSWKKSIFKR